ncbi:hypothetical protein AB0L88_35760 [Saccharopolyspora shandongensis]|uniref:hypothetical protein n=1 Tax=Saccharopolyspora shandongensis TaxID=418495 RepID=UPI00342203F1
MGFGKAVVIVAGGTVAAGALLIGVSLAMERGQPTERTTVVKVEEPTVTLRDLRCPPTFEAGEPREFTQLCGLPMNRDIERLIVPPEKPS